MSTPVRDVVAIEPVQFAGFPGEWYVRITAADGHTWHTVPWKSRWAADRCVLLLWALYDREGRVNGSARRLAPSR